MLGSFANRIQNTSSIAQPQYKSVPQTDFSEDSCFPYTQDIPLSTLDRNSMSDEADQKSSSGKEPDTMEKSATAGSLHLLSISEEDFSSLSLYEKKSTLINQEMDRMGFGK